MIVDVAPSLANPYTFTGRRFDEETGFFYFRNRYYGAELGRFLNRDPIGFVDGLNYFEYVGSSPLSGGDPFGYSKGGQQNIRPSDIPADWTVDQVKTHLQKLIERGASPKHIRAVKGYLKVLSRGSAILGPVLIVVGSDSEANAGEYDPGWRTNTPGGRKCSCVCKQFERSYEPPAWWDFRSSEYGPWRERGGPVDHGMTTAAECTKKESRKVWHWVVGGGHFEYQTRCSWGGSDRSMPNDNCDCER